MCVGESDLLGKKEVTGGILLAFGSSPGGDGSGTKSVTITIPR